MSEEWKMVPVEPTPEMIKAGAKGRQNSARSSFADGWKLALAASPAAPEAPAPEPVAWIVEWGYAPSEGIKYPGRGGEIIRTNRAAVDDKLSHLLALDSVVWAKDTPLYTHPAPAFTVDELAQEIRRVDGNNSLGAGQLAEALMPFLSRHGRPAILSLLKEEGR